MATSHTPAQRAAYYAAKRSKMIKCFGCGLRHRAPQCQITTCFCPQNHDDVHETGCPAYVDETLDLPEEKFAAAPMCQSLAAGEPASVRKNADGNAAQ